MRDNFGWRTRITLYHDLAFNLNNKGQTDVMLLDFSKAFDKVPHEHLFLKLQYYGIEETHLIGYPHFYLIVLNVLYVVVLPQTLLTYLAVFPKEPCWGLYFF